MKFLKILAVVMAVCLLGTAFIACDKGGDKGTETDAAATKVEITLVIKDGSSEKYRDTIKCDGTLGNAIEMFCVGEFEQEDNIFDANGLLDTIGELSAGDGKHWKAYYEDEGQSKAFESIKKQAVTAGKTVIVVLN